MPKVFISYSHDDNIHVERVLNFADTLRGNGIETILDGYTPVPIEGWPLWMEKNIQTCDFIILICTSNYLRRWNLEEDPDKGKGVAWEAHLIRNLFYASKSQSAKFIPVLLLPNRDNNYIPLPLREHTHYSIENFNLMDSGYEILLRHLTDQPATPPPSVGSVPYLPPHRP